MGAALLAALVSLAARPQTAEPEGCFADCTRDLHGEIDTGPLPGAPAPVFAVTQFDPASGDRRRVDLSALLDGRPLILAFGSFT